ncbi:CHAT domain-containing protein [Trichothermofontia sp.]
MVKPWGKAQLAILPATIGGVLGMAIGPYPTQRVAAQEITPAKDGVGTQVERSGDRFDIRGGQRSNDGANLFHSFERFGLTRTQIANFIADPKLRNILGRVVGNEVSFVDGVLQVTGGNANLFLMNPAGIILGPNARLDIPASFTATTANGIGFSLDRWFAAIGTSDYNRLTGSPAFFAFTTPEAGTVLNLGSLAVASGDLTLLGGTVATVPQLAPSGGKVTLAAVPGETLVRVRQEGALLSLEFQPLAEFTAANNGRPLNLQSQPRSVPTLPELLTGGQGGNATELLVNDNGIIELTGSGFRLEETAGLIRLDVNDLNGNPAIAAPVLTIEEGKSNGNGTLVASNSLTTSDTSSAPTGPDGGTAGPIAAPEETDNTGGNPRLAAATDANQTMPPQGVTTASAIGDTLAPGQIESSRTQELEQFLGEALAAPALTEGAIRATLQRIAQQTGQKTAIIYVFVQPTYLELVLLPPTGEPIFKRVPTASKALLMATVRQFVSAVRTPNNTHRQRYLQPAQQLYQWLIAPLAADLAQHQIDTLLFSLDPGLRAIPLAALHDGNQFLVEKYSLGLTPSINLTDTRYVSLRRAKVLALGRSEFDGQSPLPSVPFELSTIIETQWQGKALINENFTVDRLKGLRRQESFPIVHLATHADFKPGDANNAYIQLWDERLQLNQLRKLNWNNPPLELLVLSACRTAVGDEAAELGFAGLAVQAGAKSVLASLWYVNDEGTLGFMTEFYRQLHQAPIKAEALRQTQIAMLRGEVRIENGYLISPNQPQGLELPGLLSVLGNQTLAHPAYWAGFTMVGSPW